MGKLSQAESNCYQLFRSIGEKGQFSIVNPQGEEFEFGTGSVTSPQKLRVFVKNPDTYKDILAFSSFGAGESYTEGWWDEENDNLADLAVLLLEADLHVNIKLSLVLKLLIQKLLTLPIMIQNSRKNVQYHYDISSDFFQLVLGGSMTYSGGFQIHPTDSLEQMQLQKYEWICQQLNLQAGENLIDIGCGWGAMLIYAAENYDIHGTGVTLSQEQAQFAQRQIAQRGLSDRIKIVVLDYRQVEGQFDKLVSIEMFEHVGQYSFSTFMQKIAALLKPDGVGLLRTTGTTGQIRYEPWVTQYICPGFYLPKLHELTHEMLKAGLTVAHCENMKPHFVATFKNWSSNLKKNKAEIFKLSKDYDEAFFRKWYYYLQVSEAGYRSENLQLYEVLFFRGTQWNIERPLDVPRDMIHSKTTGQSLSLVD